VSFDKVNFARTVTEQQSGISPQMWPIVCPDNGNLALNHPYEIAINPCDCIWLPCTYDKSYGVNPWQNDPNIGKYFTNPIFAGQNIFDVMQVVSQPVGFPFPYIIQAPHFALRFNSPNNPWLLWGLGEMRQAAAWGASGVVPWGRQTQMRSISGPISRMWIQYYEFAQWPLNSAPKGGNQIVLLSMRGYAQESIERIQLVNDTTGILTSPQAEHREILSCGGYRSPDLNTADLSALGVKPTTTAGL